MIMMMMMIKCGPSRFALLFLALPIKEVVGTNILALDLFRSLLTKLLLLLGSWTRTEAVRNHPWAICTINMTRTKTLTVNRSHWKNLRHW